MLVRSQFSRTKSTNTKLQLTLDKNIGYKIPKSGEKANSDSTEPLPPTPNEDLARKLKSKSELTLY